MSDAFKNPISYALTFSVVRSEQPNIMTNLIRGLESFIGSHLRMLRKRMCIATLIAFGSSGVAAEWTTRDIHIDGTPVKLVLPDEYLRAPDDDNALHNSRQLLPDYFVFANYRTSTPHQFVQVQMYKAEQSYRYTRESFLEILKGTKTELPSYDTKEIKDMFDRRLGEFEEANFTLMKPVIFPLAGESDRHFIIPFLMGVTGEQPVKRQIVIAGATITIALNGRILYLHVYSPFVDKSTISKVTELARQIAARTLAAN